MQSGGNVAVATLKAPDAKTDDFDEYIYTELLPDRLEIEIDDQGFNHFSGEHQRVASTLALVARSELLLVDEPISRLAPCNEGELTGVPQEASGSHTQLVATHRVPTVRAAHRIVMPDDGRASSVDTHEQLLTEAQFYHWLTTSHYTQVAGERGVAAP